MIRYIRSVSVNDNSCLFIFFSSHTLEHNGYGDGTLDRTLAGDLGLITANRLVGANSACVLNNLGRVKRSEEK